MKKLSYKTAILIIAPIIFIVGAIFSLYAIYPKKYADEVNTYSKIYGVENSLVFAVIKVESGFNPRRVSDKGAAGLMQIMPSTANYIAEDLFGENPGNIFDEKTNIRYGTRYLKYLIEKFGGISVALAAYNAGEGKVKEWLKDERYSLDGSSLIAVPYKETENYVKKVLRAQNFYKILYNLSS